MPLPSEKGQPSRLDFERGKGAVQTVKVRHCPYIPPTDQKPQLGQRGRGHAKSPTPVFENPFPLSLVYGDKQ